MRYQPSIGGHRVVARDRLRPADLAREHSLSTQAVRNYEDAGILPRPSRSLTGYRQYGPLHAQALRTFLALRPGYGHQAATEILRAVNAGDNETAYRVIDHGHAQLLHDRATLDEVSQALNALTSVELSTSAQQPPATIGVLAHQLGLHPATLRKWEQAGILRPYRDPATGYRHYPPDSVRDAHLAHQLRRGGYLLDQIAPCVARVRDAGGLSTLDDTLSSWRATLQRRNRAMLDGSAQLAEYLQQVGR